MRDEGAVLVALAGVPKRPSLRVAERKRIKGSEDQRIKGLKD